MKADETVRLLEFVKKHGELVKKPSRSEVRAKGLIALVVTLVAVAFVVLTWLSWEKEWDMGLAVFGAGSFVLIVKSLEQIAEYLEVKRKSKMSYAELISEDKENGQTKTSPLHEDDWDDSRDRGDPYDPINSYSHHWMDLD